MRRGLTAEIDLDAAANNVTVLREAADGAAVYAVVKADAYGHGAVRLSRTFLQAGATGLAVAFTSEARELREAGVQEPILVLFDRGDPETCLELDATPVLHDVRTAEALDREAYRRSMVLDVHVKVDTGMGRMGLVDASDVTRIASLSNLRISGLMSHLSEADLADTAFVDHQLERFAAVRQELSRSGIRPLCHVANSAASLALPAARLDAIRPGLALYGVSPFDHEHAAAQPLRPVMRVLARIAAIRRLPAGQPVSYGRTYVTKRETLAVVLAVGYADGYLRTLSNQGHVLLRGRPCPVIGRVCMDLIVVDATELETLSDKDTALLLGRQGAQEVDAWELARAGGTIPYELLTSLGRSSERVYLGGG